MTLWVAWWEHNWSLLLFTTTAGKMQLLSQDVYSRFDLTQAFDTVSRQGLSSLLGS